MLTVLVPGCSQCVSVPRGQPTGRTSPVKTRYDKKLSSVKESNICENIFNEESNRIHVADPDL